MFVGTQVFENYTEAAKHIVVLAEAEARRLRDPFIRTSHLLAALARDESTDGNPTTQQMLEAKGITYDLVMEAIQKLSPPGLPMYQDSVQVEPIAKKVLELALREALQLIRTKVAPYHILLAFTREREGSGARIITDKEFFGLEMSDLRTEVMKQLGIEEVAQVYPVTEPPLFDFTPEAHDAMIAFCEWREDKGGHITAVQLDALHRYFRSGLPKSDSPPAT